MNGGFMKKSIFLIYVFFFGSIYSSENLTVALPEQPLDEASSNWGHEEFNSILPDYLIHLIMTEATLGNKVSEQGLRTEKRKANPKHQVQAVEGMLKQRGYKPGSPDYHTFLNNLADDYNDLIQRHAARLTLAEEGFVEVTPSMVNLTQREESDRQKKAERYNSLPFSTKFSTKFQQFAQPASRLFQQITSNIDPKTVETLNSILAELRQLSIQNPEQVVIDAMRTGVGNALNMLKSYIHSLKQQQIASSALKVIEDKK